jgi:hypothetical protein
VHRSLELMQQRGFADAPLSVEDDGVFGGRFKGAGYDGAGYDAQDVVSANKGVFAADGVSGYVGVSGDGHFCSGACSAENSAEIIGFWREV